MKSALPIGRTSPHKGASSFFTRAANATAAWTGKHAAFLVALGTVIVWGMSGPIFHFSDTWQLVINTGTTIITFLMVFLIQNTQNRDTMALQLKLSELIIALKDADNQFATIEDADEGELVAAREKLKAKAERK